MKAISSAVMILRRGRKGKSTCSSSPSRKLKFPKELGYVMGSYCNEALGKVMPQMSGTVDHSAYRKSYTFSAQFLQWYSDNGYNG